MVRVDPGQCLEVGRQEHVLRTAEAEPPRRRPEPVEDGLDGCRVAPPERPNRDTVDALRLHMGHAADGPWPAASARRAIFPRWPVRATTLRSMEQEIRYLDFEGRRLAYSTYGEGPPIVVGPRWVSHLEEEWADADQRPFYAELARTHRVVRFDRIGCGLSSRELDPRPTVESESRQLEAVIDAVGGERCRPGLVVLLPRCFATRRSAAGRDRQDRLLRRLRHAPRHPGGDEGVADRVHRLELAARRADARGPVRPTCVG